MWSLHVARMCSSALVMPIAPGPSRAVAHIVRWMEATHNRRRRHSSLGMLAPIASSSDTR